MATTEVTAPVANTTYTPATPVQVVHSTVMSQDVVTTQSIPVDSNSASPLGVFVNPSSGGTAGAAHVEALAIVNGQVSHVARNGNTDAGWCVTQPFGARQAQAVAAGTAYAGSTAANVYGHFSDSEGVYFTQLQNDGVTWSNPQTISSTAGNVPSTTNLKPAYSPAGRLVLYGNTPSGDLVTTYQPQINGEFVGSVVAMNGALSQGDFHLTMVDETNWTLAANQEGQAWLYTGELGASEPSSSEQAQFPGILQQVVLGYWSSVQNTLIFLFVDADNILHSWVNTPGGTPTARLIPNSRVKSAAGHVSSLDSTLHVYSVDNQSGLWVLHQDPNTPWNQDGTPNWAPNISLGKGAAGLASDMVPSDAPRIFSLDAADNSLRLHTQDPASQMWRSGNVLQAGSQAYTLSRFRTEISLIDANGAPLLNTLVMVQVAQGYSETDIWAAGKTYRVSSTNPVSLTTDAFGKLTLAIQTHAGLSAPNLVVSAAGLAEPVVVQPAGSVHTYLSGQGMLNPTNPGGALPVFDADGNTLAAAQTSGKALAPNVQNNTSLAGTAAQAIRNTASIGLGNAPQGITGYHFSVSDPGNPKFTALHTREELEFHVALLGGEPGGIWGDIAQWSGDVWEGIKNGAINIREVVVDVVNAVATFTIQIGEMIANSVTLALKTLENAAHFIAGVFQAIAADIEMVIEWLLAMFDFAAIWRTMKAFKEALLAAPAYVKQLAGGASTLGSDWITDAKKAADNAFTHVINHFEGQTFGSQANWLSPRSASTSTVPIAGSASPSDLAHNAHHNWMQNKVSSYAPPGNTVIGPDQSSPSSDPWTAFITGMTSASDSLLDAFKDLATTMKSILEDPDSLTSTGIAGFIGMFKDLVDAVFDVIGAFLNAFLGIVDDTMDWFQALLDYELDWGFLNTLWKWIAELAGDSSDDTLTVAGLFSLLFAFPTTIIFKLVAGVDKDPFPDGHLPTQPDESTLHSQMMAARITEAQTGASGSSDIYYATKITLFCASLLQFSYFVPALITDTASPNAPPSVVRILSLTMSVLIIALSVGFPNFAVPQVDRATLYTVIGAPVAIFVVLVAAQAFQNLFPALYASIAANFTDLTLVLFSIFGVLSFAKNVVEIFLSISGVYGKFDPIGATASLLTPYATICSYLDMSFIRNNPDIAPFAWGGKVITDVVSYIVAGSIEIGESSVRLFA